MNRRIAHLYKLEHVLQLFAIAEQQPLLFWRHVPERGAPEVEVTSVIGESLIVACVVTLDEFQKWRDSKSPGVILLQGYLEFV